jgi:hypothetical protein
MTDDFNGWLTGNAAEAVCGAIWGPNFNRSLKVTGEIGRSGPDDLALFTTR